MKFLDKSLKALFTVIIALLISCASSGNSMQNTGPMTLRNYLEQAPGITITGKGASTSVSIRGMRDITGRIENSPLFVIDGNIIGRNFYRAAGMLTPNIIEDVRVLSPTESAHYGSRGMNGAVIITTKKVSK